MAVKKNKLDMTPVKKTSRGSKTGRLMDNQDTTNRGDGSTAPKTPTTILLPSDLKSEAQEYAKERCMTLTALIVDALRKRMKEE